MTGTAFPSGTATEVALTRIRVESRHGRPWVSSSTGLVRPQVVHARAGWCRIGLLATTALLLGGDEVELQVSLGAGARLDLFDVAGTVAYDGHGAPARWRTTVELEAGALLTWSGLPFVVATGADVTRTLAVELDPTAGALVRDTIILGRHGECGGRFTSSTTLRVGDRLALVEHQHLDPALRTLPGMLGPNRVLDTITALGAVSRPDRPTAQLSHFQLVGGAGTVSRYLGRELAGSPLHQWWQELTSYG